MHRGAGQCPGQELRVLLAGEAAGLLEPWSREGISFALRSGRLAGTAAAAAVLDGGSQAGVEARSRAYARALRPLTREIVAGAALLGVFERCPRLMCTTLVRVRAARRCFAAYCQGRVSLAGRVPDVVLRAASRLTLRFAD